VRRVSQAHKHRAQDDADRSTNLSLLAAFLSVAIGGSVSLVAPPVGVGAGVALAGWAAALQRHALVMQRVVRDPPDPDYRSATYVGRLRLEVELLTQDEFGRASAPALGSLLRSSSLASAMIRALDVPRAQRWQGTGTLRTSALMRQLNTRVDSARNSAGSLNQHRRHPKRLIAFRRCLKNYLAADGW
jgi:hypothetical protein